MLPTSFRVSAPPRENRGSAARGDGDSVRGGRAGAGTGGAGGFAGGGVGCGWGCDGYVGEWF